MESPTTDPLAVANSSRGLAFALARHQRLGFRAGVGVSAGAHPAAGSFTFATDAAWLESEGELIVARKVDAQVPEGCGTSISSHPVPSSWPRGDADRALTIDEEMEVGGAYAAHPERRRVVSIALEVGWVPVRAGPAC